MKLDKALELVEDAEVELAQELGTLAGRHAADHDVYHLGHTLVERSREHLTRLVPFTEVFGARSPDRDPGSSGGSPLDRLRRGAAAMLRTSEATGMMLLLDLRSAYLKAQNAEISWIILEQAAKASRELALLEVVSSCREEAEVTEKWLRTRIKETAPQVLVVS